MEIGAASSCSKEHQKIYSEWFAFADSDGDGRITGPDAIKFFGMSRLPRADLKQVGHRGLQAAGVPRLRRVRHGDAARLSGASGG
jgi:hypothetical protein